ncbi:hypothetical protein L3X38_015237 [Prunus dulcis]|uniref:Uncharacterized protein n=1 Tax=Prunus dulcis TaxID=3755 RepID=A0AAD4WPQ5_PRUDU|nr:hypothetical protein L3X38_015237 [Prunus dulcis]
MAMASFDALVSISAPKIPSLGRPLRSDRRRNFCSISRYEILIRLVLGFQLQQGSDESAEVDKYRYLHRTKGLSYSDG